MTEKTQTTVRPCGCDNGRVLVVYDRGPNDPPGNGYAACPCCAAGRAYEKSSIVLAHAFLHSARYPREQS